MKRLFFQRSKIRSKKLLERLYFNNFRLFYLNRLLLKTFLDFEQIVQNFCILFYYFILFHLISNLISCSKTICFVTTSNALKYGYNLVFLFHYFLVITVKNFKKVFFQYFLTFSLKVFTFEAILGF